MIASLRKWWRRDSDRIAELRARAAEGPETAVVHVNWEFTLRESTATTPVDHPQVITTDRDIKEIKRAIFLYQRDLISGKSRTIKTGPTCERCGQSGLAYRVGGQTRILVCDHVQAGLNELMWQRVLETYDRCSGTMPWIPPGGEPHIIGIPVESVPCGRHLLMTLRMRYCWSD